MVMVCFASEIQYKELDICTILKFLILEEILSKSSVVN